MLLNLLPRWKQEAGTLSWKGSHEIKNIEADAITNNDFSAFDKAHMIEADPAKMQFKVLNEMLDLGDKFYEQREVAKTAAQASSAEADTSAQGPRGLKVVAHRCGKGGRKKSLKESQPW